MKGNGGFEGWRGAGGRYFVIFLVAGRLFGSFLGDGSTEIGKWEAGGWNMEAQN